ncbi:hypothetical protein [Streptomyces sp. KLOTTS4A1]|uniref:hypothetical protein n=1 Tax=Streptomyces sp. KLOTTS4A1 TaxID=3390996 RepID=UPI0039F45EA6
MWFRHATRKTLRTLGALVAAATAATSLTLLAPATVAVAVGAEPPAARQDTAVTLSDHGRAIAPAAAGAGAGAGAEAGAEGSRADGEAVTPMMAETGGGSNTMLFGGLAIVLCGLGALALAASRSHRD